MSLKRKWCLLFLRPVRGRSTPDGLFSVNSIAGSGTLYQEEELNVDTDLLRWNPAHCASVFRSCMVEESGTLESQLKATKVSTQSALATPEAPSQAATQPEAAKAVFPLT